MPADDPAFAKVTFGFGYPEFNERSLSSLLWELADLRPDLAHDVRVAQTRLAVFRTLLVIHRETTANDVMATQQQAVARTALAEMSRVETALKPFLDRYMRDEFKDAYNAELDGALDYMSKQPSVPPKDSKSRR
jgi:hypothetical protein